MAEFSVNTCKRDDEENGYSYNVSDEYDSTISQEVVPIPLFFTIIYKMYLFIHPALCIAGMIENMISVLVFCSKTLRKVSSNVYLAALSFASSLFCFANFLVWLETLNVHLIHQDGVCQIVVYVTYVCSFLTVWFVVCVTFENFLISVNLKYAVLVCTVNKARFIVASLTSFAVGLYSFSLWTTQTTSVSGTKHCTQKQKYEFVIHAFTYVDIMVTSVLPLLTMIIFLGTIYAKHVLQRVVHKVEDVEYQSREPRRNSKRSHQMLTKITRVLLAIGITYIVLSCPASVNRIRILLFVNPNIRYLHVEWAINQLCLMIYNCSFCVYFFIYLAFSMNYRKMIFDTIRLIKCDK